tara:strand:+ start:1314 stop:2279 length:966 start_codon:yes stop_codon:yes gene_type:complete
VALDALGRRKRLSPTSTGKSISLQPADLLWFQKLYEHGPLPSSFLLAYSQNQRLSQKRAKERLTDLFNEETTKHGGRYLERPPQQFRTIDSRYNQLVYDLGKPAIKALRETGEMPSMQRAAAGPWVHRFMVACVTASIELATIKRDDVSFIAGHRVLARAETELRYPVSITDPKTDTTIIKDLIPDALFGLEYYTEEGSRFRFFLVECDRGTEPATTKNFNRKSWLRSLRQYAEYIGRGRYREHLKLTSPLLVLNVVPDETRLEQLLAVTEKDAGSGGNPYQLFQTIEGFGSFFRPPSPITDLLERPWQRVEREEFRIDRP